MFFNDCSYTVYSVSQYITMSFLPQDKQLQAMA